MKTLAGLLIGLCLFATPSSAQSLNLAQIRIFNNVNAACGGCVLDIQNLTPADPAGWVIDFNPGATADQQTAARATLAGYNAAAFAAIQATIDQVIAASAGMTVSVGGVSATYAITPAAMTNVAGIYSGIKNANHLPGGGSSFNYLDLVGAAHSFTMAQFASFAQELEDYAYALSQGQVPSAPAAIP